MEFQQRKSTRQTENRVILQFDYDCFYAQVVENKDPSLKPLPLGIQQKNILATCNYNARRLGVRKLMFITEAKKLCPQMVIVNGEDLTPFRDTSKILFNFFRSHSWNNKVERLGFDEIFMDITDIVKYNLRCLNRGSLATSFFQLSQKDPQHGFPCDLTQIAGNVEGNTQSESANIDNVDYVRLLLGSHLALYLRQKLEEEFGYTSTCGIAVNKVLSKLVGSRNKPRAQTTLLTLEENDAVSFMRNLTIGKIPGLGRKTAKIIESHVQTNQVAGDESDMDELKTVVKDVILNPNVTPSSLERALGGPGAERGVGQKIWNLLHGLDPSPVKDANDFPSQISIEDTYKGLETMPQITEELYKLACSLIRRIRVELLSPDDSNEGSQRWLARPKTVRLAMRSWPEDRTRPREWSRVSRSAALPTFVFDQDKEIEALAERLLGETLLPLLRRLEPEKGPSWNLQLLNVCVADMQAGAGNERTGAGRDISVMFKRQDEVLRPWKVTSVSDNEGSDNSETGQFEDEAVDWEGVEVSACSKCGHSIPPFAMLAHMRFHDFGDG